MYSIKFFSFILIIIFYPLIRAIQQNDIDRYKPINGTWYTIDPNTGDGYHIYEVDVKDAYDISIKVNVTSKTSGRILKPDFNLFNVVLRNGWEDRPALFGYYETKATVRWKSDEENFVRLDSIKLWGQCSLTYYKGAAPEEDKLMMWEIETSKQWNFSEGIEIYNYLTRIPQKQFLNVYK